MKRIITTIAALAVSLAFVTTAEAKKPKGEGKGGDPAAQFDAKDTDKDGFLTKKEYTAGAKDEAKAGAHFDKIAKGADKISKADFIAVMEAHKKKAK
ncbi:MAG: hypothetical protein ABI318_13995 [Chthoniobacteraceae bacterium]